MLTPLKTIHRRRAHQAAARRGAQLIVVDPRRIELAEYANCVPLRPGSNVPLFNALAHVIVEEGSIDAAYVRERVANSTNTVHLSAHGRQACGADLRCGT